MSDTARLLDDMAGRLFSRALADPFARADATLPARLHAEADEAGLPLALVSEEAGGMGGTLEEACVIAWQAGYHAAPLPIVAQLLMPTLPVASEGATLAQPGGQEAPGPATRILCPTADAIAVHAAAPAFTALDHTPWVRAQGPALELIPCPGLGARLEVQGACLTAAAMLGAMARVLEITLDHANTRKQFGKPLGKFQAIQHRLAEAASEHAVAQAALAGAVQAADGGWLRPILWQSAKAQAGRAATIVTGAAHQILGAIGFTEEHVLHHYSKRLWVWRDDWGRQSALEAAIGAAACADPRGLWPHIADTP